MALNGSYGGNADRTASVSDIEYATDPASAGFFNSDYKKHEDLKKMLDVNKDSLKLEAMKRIICMIAKGKDASELFPSVVKNVVSKNVEVKKLVYVYLVRYAEEQQDLALLSISTFQRALKDPNQLIRGSALRVLSSIRVSMIVPIVMLAIKDASADMSPYVRKTAAHAIPKLYNLDAEQKEELILVVDKLLADKTTLVVGSAVMAFEEVCPERIDLIHKNYRKLCNLLADVDEWGQVIIVNMLTRYARTQFLDPNINAFEDDDLDSENVENDYDSDNENSHIKKKMFVLDQDHKLLLRNSRPLLQSRNAAVVMSVAQLYHHLAPKSDVAIVTKSLIRLLRSHREVQSTVLNSIASISTIRKSMFEPFLKSFFVRTNDPTHIKVLKLEILTNLATESNISTILREFQTYISSTDKQFVAAAVHAIGRCASNIKEVRDSCLSGLVSMLSNKDEAVVAESVVVIKKLLQTHPNAHTDIITHMAKLMDNIMVPQARASILWLLGEYSYLVPKIAPDVLRKMAKSFISEEDIVKLQILNLAVKLVLTNESQTKLLCQYVLTLARYDQNYDIRDRSRLLRQILFPQNENSKLTKHARSIFLATKPAPLLQSKFIDREEFQIGSLSHYINARASGYYDLPPFPEVPQDSSVRNVASEIIHAKVSSNRQPTSSKKSSFYSDSENSSPPEEDSDESEGSSEDGSETSAEDTSDWEDETQSRPIHANIPRKSALERISNYNRNELAINNNSDEDEEISEDDDDDDEDDSSGSSSSEAENSKDPEQSNHLDNKRRIKPDKKETRKPSNIDLLLELDDFPTQSSTILPVALLPASLPNTSTMMTDVSSTTNTLIKPCPPSFVPNETFELISKISGANQLSIHGRFMRSIISGYEKMVAVELTFNNHSTDKLTDIRAGTKNEKVIHPFEPVPSIEENQRATRVIGTYFNDSTQPIEFDILWKSGDVSHKATVTVRAPIGELVRPIYMPDWLFIEEQDKLKGMNEHSTTINFADEIINLSRSILKVVNFGPVIKAEDNILRHCGQTVASKSFVLLTLVKKELVVTITVHCEKMLIGSMILNEIKNHLSH